MKELKIVLMASSTLLLGNNVNSQRHSSYLPFRKILLSCRNWNILYWTKSPKEKMANFLLLQPSQASFEASNISN